MKIISIDPGIEKVGYAVLKQEKKISQKISYLSSGLIKTKKKDEQAVRLKHIDDQIKTLIDLHKPEAMVIEQLFYFKNAKTVISVAQAQGVIICAAAQKDFPVYFITPLQIKLALAGYGNADKKAVLKMVQLQLEGEITVADDDESDAIACGMAYFFQN